VTCFARPGCAQDDRVLGDSGDNAALLASLGGTDEFVRPYTSKIRFLGFAVGMTMSA
jgi:hypothetical protein